MISSLKSTVNKNNPIVLFLSDLKQLTKVGLSMSVVFSSVAGFLIAKQSFEVLNLFYLIVGGFLMVAASNTFNQVIEKDTDALMDRTKNRPLPSKRMQPITALIIAFVFVVLGTLILIQLNQKTALFGVLSVFLYTCAYTPLKPVTPLTVFVGAIPGAIPFMLGWVAATNAFGIEPGVLFMVQFFWQFPHFWAIGWLQYDAYNKAGFKMLPTGQKNKVATKQIILYTIIMVVASVLPVFKKTGVFYILPLTAILCVLMALPMLIYAFKLHKHQNDIMAKKLMIFSVLYITLIQIIYVVDQYFHL